MEELLDKLRSLSRIIEGRNESPGTRIIDSRSVKISHHADAVRGLDRNKKIKDRKQHVVVDAQGYTITVAVQEGNIHDSKGAPKVIEKLSCEFPRLSNTLADGGYRGNVADWVLDKYGWKLEVVLKLNERPSKFKIIL